MYCNLNKIFYDNYYINIPFKSIINIHVLLFIKFKNVTIGENFQAFLDKEPIGIFDRITVSEIDLEKNDLILSCRLSKNYKNYDKKFLEKKYLDFLIQKNLLNKECIIKDIYYYNYDCSYRDADTNRNIFYKEIKKINEYYKSEKIIPLNTIYMGHFLNEIYKISNYE